MKTWVEINKQNLLYNLEQFRKRIDKNVFLTAVVKANAYGHGLEQVAQIVNEKADWFAVDSVDEALILKKQGIDKPILILGYTVFDRLHEVVENNFHQVVANLETIQKLDQLTKEKGSEVNVHLKIETGTSRQGIFEKDLDKFIEYFLNNKLLKLAGASTHYANIEDTTDHTFAQSQLEKYNKAIEKIKKAGFTDFVKHTACSAAGVLFPKTHFDLVRIGISMYGMWSSKETQASAKQKGIEFNLKPALTWKTKIAHIKELPAGATVSYGCTEKLSAKTKVAVLPVGYWDGFDRGLSSVGNVLVHGTRCKVLGRVCMNMVVIDVNHLADVKLEDEVVLLGKQGSEEISAEEIAQKCNTINYEVVTRINSGIARIIV